MTKVEYRQFIAEVEFAGKEKKFAGLTNKIFKSFSYKRKSELLKDKRAAYDFMISGLFSKYGIVNNDLYDQFDSIWNSCFSNEMATEALLSKAGAPRLIVNNGEEIKNILGIAFHCPLLYNPVENLFDLQHIMKEYMKRVYDYCDSYARERINE